MNNKSTNYIIYFLVITLWTCSNKVTEQKEIDLIKDYDQIEDLISEADCDSPFGKYTTEVHSFSDGSCYFIQNFDDSNSSFIVKLDSLNNGYLINEQQITIDTLSPTDVEMIRGHEIHKMSINPNFFFRNIEYQKQIEHLEIEHELYSGKDGLDNPIKIIYNRNEKLIRKIELLNPRDTTQSIEINFDKWIQSDYGAMVKEIRIIQANKDTFHFDFKTLKIRDKTGYNNVYN